MESIYDFDINNAIKYDNNYDFDKLDLEEVEKNLDDLIEIFDTISDAIDDQEKIISDMVVTMDKNINDIHKGTDDLIQAHNFKSIATTIAAVGIGGLVYKLRI